MNIKEYISSGIVESYVMGLADEAERAEFESMCSAHEEVRAARDSFEQALEEQAMLGAVAPPPQIRKNIFAELELTTPVVNINRNAEPGSDPYQKQPSNNLRYLAAASVALLIGSAILNFYLFQQYKDYSNRYSSLLASQTELAKNNQSLQTSLNTYRSAIDRLKDPGLSVIKMAAAGVPANGSPDPASVATIYWDRKTAEVFLLVNNLPTPTTGKQYQLWAIVDGKPVSAGVFDIDVNQPVLKMGNIPQAQAFAVTLENAGGSTAPTGAMYVLGAI